MLRSNCLKAKQIRSILPICHSCILCLALLTPFTLYPSTDLFHGFRILQTLLMGQYVLLSPNGNKKLQALLQGTLLHRMFRFSSSEHLVSLIQSFHTEQAVYLRFSHVANFQPKFYIGSTSSTILDREHTRFRKFIQVQQNKFVLAEVALRFWNRFDNFWMWSIFPLFTDNPNFWALEQALIQLWQPRLNTPFIYQFFNCRKGLIVQRPFSSTRQFGTFSLWRKLRWASTPQRVRATFYSKRFFDRTLLWEVIQHLGSNSLKRFQMEKRIRSHEFGLHGCYFVRKLASNLGEPQRSYALNAIDRAIKFWKGKRVPRCLPLLAPWLLSPTWTSDLRKLLKQHIAQMRPYTVTFQSPSSAVVFTKNPSVMDSLCNHKDYATRWADGEPPSCICSILHPHHSTPTPSSTSTHLHLDGDSLTLHSPSLTSIATGSLQPFSPGTRGMPFHPYPLASWKSFGPRHGLNISNSFKITSPTETLPASPNFSLGPFSTMKTSALLLCESPARASTSSA